MTTPTDTLIASPDPKAQELLIILRSALGDHAVRTWLSLPTAWLGGAVPIELFVTDPDRVITAARRFTSNIY